MIDEKWVVLGPDGNVYFEADLFLDCAHLIDAVYELDPALKGSLCIRFISSAGADDK